MAYYLTDHGGVLATSTLRRRLAAISEAHKAARDPNPTTDPAVRIVWDGNVGGRAVLVSARGQWGLLHPGDAGQPPAGGMLAPL